MGTVREGVVVVQNSDGEAEYNVEEGEKGRAAQIRQRPGRVMDARKALNIARDRGGAAILLAFHRDSMSQRLS